MLQLTNKTPFEAALNLFPDVEGIDSLFVVVKASFTLGSELTVAEEQVPVQLEDDYHGEPGLSSIRLASEAHLPKVATDVVLVGSAHAPGGRPVTQLSTSLRVGPVSKRVDVVGDRRWTGNWIGRSKTSPEPFTTMPLVYERAFGGTHVKNEEKGKFTRVDTNPVGTGYHAGRRRSELEGLLAPNLVDPKDDSRPAAYGFVGPDWKPRVRYVGTYDEAWQRTRSPYLPLDFDPRFFNAAHPDLVVDGFLRGGEPVELLNLSPRGDLRFALPRCDFQLDVYVGDDVERPEPRLETVLLLPDQDTLCLQWRAAVRCDKRTLAVNEVVLRTRALELNGRAVA